MTEEFRDVPGYEGVYEVSNLGRVKNIETGRILKPFKDTNGYLILKLSKDGTRRTVKVHRLVALAFLPNPQNLPQVNHKDENKTNNAVSNLEWCTAGYNVNYSQSKPVLQFDLQGNFIKEWPSTVKVEEELGIYQTNISKCCLGKRNSAGGYLWKFKN